MKICINPVIRRDHFRFSSMISFIAGLMILTISCSRTPVPYSILNIAGTGDILSNYSKSFLLTAYKPDSLDPASIAASPGDLFIADDYTFVLDKNLSTTFSMRVLREGLYLNDKLVYLEIPDNDDLIPWFESLENKDLSALQFIGLRTELPDSYLPHLSRLAEIKPDVGLLYEGSIRDIKGLLEIFDPPYLVGVDLQQSDLTLLQGMKNLQVLVASFTDYVSTTPLPELPKLKQLVLTDLDKSYELPANFLVHNKQLERLILHKPVKFNLAMLDPLKNLKELVVRESGDILNPVMLNGHKKLEVLVIGDKYAGYDLNMIKLPRLRWMTFFNNTTQQEFDTFINSHPSLEVIEMAGCDTIHSLRVLSELGKLSCLTITDTVTDIGSVAKLTNLKYLSLPAAFIDDSTKLAGIKSSLPGTRIVANEGFCLGSGWILLIIPLVLMIRFFCRKVRHEDHEKITV
ncbi:MAG TPA: hypothetical protein PKX27_02070 [Bacteroidales bacterium]|nr:hypothetical protein [Bacteroidales bacterium]HOX73614.1 hypothetical protein [Bacteroidales bacterium]HPM86742.1 hypothetical protein [Bacteroidales bacterium]HQM68869.1 hypothetical protein [Bacteroidales bacterium]